MIAMLFVLLAPPYDAKANGALEIIAAAEQGLQDYCDNAQTQAEMNACAAADFAAADAELNIQWAKTSAKLKETDNVTGQPTDGRPSYYEALLEAQRSWLAYRDANCRVEGYKLRGGSAEPMEVSGCMAIMTRARTAELRELVETY
jgi:uncharacterized protein YecT (DUF1311 family)